MCSFCDSVPIKLEQKKMLFFLAFLALALFAGLRINLPDYDAYSLFFQLLNDDKVINNEADLTIVANDKGYILINKLIGIFTSNPVVLFLVMAFLAVGINLSCYKKYTPYFFTAILFYFVHTYVARELMQIRAGVACALCLYSVRYIVSKKMFHFACVIILASTIHLAALVFLFAYLLCHLNLGVKNLSYSIIISLIIGIFLPLGQFLKSLPYMEGLERIQNYSGWEGFNQTLGVFSNPTVLKQLIITAVCLKFYDRLNQTVYAFRVLLIIYVFSLCWLVVWNDFGIVAARISTFFSIGEVLLVASLYNIFSSKKMYTVVVGVASFMFLTLNILKGSLNYHCILFN